ncbi:MAG TPA: hypothetical protein VJ779_06115 [Acetobacteraceae bacterium]|nr:hypothetical protein [Acetobacteraceae bacterium]
MHRWLYLPRLNRKPSWNFAIPVAALSAICLLAPDRAYAHIKWFCPYDTTVPPLPLADVLTPSFAFIAAGFGALMFVAYVIDGIVERKGWLGSLDRALLGCEPAISVLVRASVCIFFLILWMDGRTILTPELKTTSAWVPWLQLAVAAFTLWRRTLVLAGAGIAVLYMYGVARYGAFHMLDYPIFLGLAAYLGLSAAASPFLSKLRLPVLYFNLVVTMMWGAIEKFGYPYWTFPLLATHKGLAFGMPFGLFMTVAGFVELSLAFFMLTGTALLRASCLALLLIMASAIPEFGKIDAIGHFLIIVTLIAMIIAGRSAIRLPSVIRDRGVLASSSLLGLAYATTTVGLFAVYYGAQYIAGR